MNWSLPLNSNSFQLPIRSIAEICATMKRIIVCIALAILVSLQLYTSDAAPTIAKQLIDMSEDELMMKFSKFINEDKAVLSMLEKFRAEGHLLQKRQADDGMELDGMDDVEVDTKREGFMDRAAKFVLELVQRFLKWINTD